MKSWRSQIRFEKTETFQANLSVFSPEKSLGNPSSFPGRNWPLNREFHVDKNCISVIVEQFDLDYQGSSWKTPLSNLGISTNLWRSSAKLRDVYRGTKLNPPLEVREDLNRTKTFAEKFAEKFCIRKFKKSWEVKVECQKFKKLRGQVFSMLPASRLPLNSSWIANAASQMKNSDSL